MVRNHHLIIDNHIWNAEGYIVHPSHQSTSPLTGDFVFALIGLLSPRKLPSLAGRTRNTSFLSHFPNYLPPGELPRGQAVEECLAHLNFEGRALGKRMFFFRRHLISPYRLKRFGGCWGRDGCGVKEGSCGADRGLLVWRLVVWLDWGGWLTEVVLGWLGW